MAMVRRRVERAGPIGLARRACELWALFGGAALIAIVLMTAYSLLAGLLFDAPVAGEYELVEIGIAIAVFAFLPYCQIEGANVSADIFTSGAGPRAIAILALLASVVALVTGAVLLWRMAVGMEGYIRYEERTAIIGIPIWVAFIPILISLALLFVAALVTLIESARDVKQG